MKINIMESVKLSLKTSIININIFIPKNDYSIKRPNFIVLNEIVRTYFPVFIGKDKKALYM